MVANHFIVDPDSRWFMVFTIRSFLLVVLLLSGCENDSVSLACEGVDLGGQFRISDDGHLWVRREFGVSHPECANEVIACLGLQNVRFASIEDFELSLE
jgi:hypothetical protein